MCVCGTLWLCLWVCGRVFVSLCVGVRVYVRRCVCLCARLCVFVCQCVHNPGELCGKRGVVCAGKSREFAERAKIFIRHKKRFQAFSLFWEDRCRSNHCHQQVFPCSRSPRLEI